MHKLEQEKCISWKIDLEDPVQSYHANICINKYQNANIKLSSPFNRNVSKATFKNPFVKTINLQGCVSERTSTIAMSQT